MRPGRYYISRKVLDDYDDDPRDFGRRDDRNNDPDEDEASFDEVPEPTDSEDEE